LEFDYIMINNNKITTPRAANVAAKSSSQTTDTDDGSFKIVSYRGASNAAPMRTGTAAGDCYSRQGSSDSENKDISELSTGSLSHH